MSTNRTVVLPNGDVATFTPRTAENRGFIRVGNRTISGTVTAGEFTPNTEAPNRLWVELPQRVRDYRENVTGV